MSTWYLAVPMSEWTKMSSDLMFAGEDVSLLAATLAPTAVEAVLESCLRLGAHSALTACSQRSLKHPVSFRSVCSGRRPP